MKLLILIITLALSSLSMAQELTIAAVGDVLLHKPLQKKGLTQGFESLWQEVIPLLKRADISYANLEGPIAENINSRGQKVTTSSKRIYTSFPLFNYPPQLATALKASGIDIVSTANNHSLDRYSIGIDKTIEALNKNTLFYSGTRHSNENNSWYTVTKAKSMTVAWLACTQDTNGIKDVKHQVLYCYKDLKTILTLIKQLTKINDAVIVTPHWGKQYQLKPSSAQKRLAKKFLKAGALAVLGSHPHCAQPIQSTQHRGNTKKFVIYSLGNFVSNQGSLKNRASGVLYLTLKKTNANTTIISKVTYFPTYMQNRGGKLQLTRIKSKSHPAYRLLERIIGRQYLSLN
jgi:poly-gamma-glutamate capsule biosynthesis protein CapA/YwtB (metallophosphatase superfamily)